jgi:4-oxalocrotonate tautomerase family enzyme
MPQVNIQIVGKSPSNLQKAVLFARMTDLMVDVLGRTRKLVVVSITSAPAPDWAVGGEACKDDAFVGVQVVIRVIAGASSNEQKSRMIAETTSVLRNELGSPILPLYVTFDEVPATAWGYDGQTIAAIAAAKAAS